MILMPAEFYVKVGASEMKGISQRLLIKSGNRITGPSFPIHDIYLRLIQQLETM